MQILCTQNVNTVVISLNKAERRLALFIYFLQLLRISYCIIIRRGYNCRPTSQGFVYYQKILAPKIFQFKIRNFLSIRVKSCKYRMKYETVFEI
jgi:hypothetical protein